MQSLELFWMLGIVGVMVAYGIFALIGVSIRNKRNQQALLNSGKNNG